MKNVNLITISFLLLIGCGPNVSEEATKNEMGNDFTPSAVDNEKGNSLFVFVGEKIEVKEFHPDAEEGIFIMDYAFKAKYRILKNVYGTFKQDTIEFIAYDHYGPPAFSEYKNVLIFVSFQEGEFYHEKYQFFDLYKTKEGKWASPYSSDDYTHPFNENTVVKPEKINFSENVRYEIKNADLNHIEQTFPSPFYQVKGNEVIPIYGNYIDELFKLKRDGVLKARELF